MRPPSLHGPWTGVTECAIRDFINVNSAQTTQMLSAFAYRVKLAIAGRHRPGPPPAPPIAGSGRRAGDQHPGDRVGVMDEFL